MIGSYIKVSKPKGKDGDGERWAMGGVSPTMNVFENQTSTRATVVIVKCYENHAQDARVREIQGGYEVSTTVNAQMSALEPTACVWLGTTTTEPPNLKRATPGAQGAIPATASSFGGIDE